MAAMRRFYEFIVEGKVPEDLTSTDANARFGQSNQ